MPRFSGHPLSTALFVLSGLLSLAACQPNQSKNAAPPPAAQVKTITITPQPFVQYTELKGRTTARLVAQVRPQVSGIVQKRLFEEGGYVKAGQALYQIDPASWQANYNSAKAAVAKAEANLESAQTKHSRYSELIRLKAISKQDLDDAQASFKQAQAEVMSAKAALETARINLAYTQVKAPISGQIGQSSVTAGALVQQGQADALATIQQLDPIYVTLTQTTTELLALKRQLNNGDLKSANTQTATVALTLEDGSTYNHTGKLQFSEVAVDPDTGAITLRAQFPNPEKLLLPGMYVKARLEQGTQTNAILVPQQAIARDSTGTAIAMVLNDKGLVEQRKVETGTASNGQWLIQSGLKAGEQLIVEGLQKIKPGQPAQVISRM